MQSTSVASFRKMTPGMLASQQLAMANDIVQTTKAEVAITLKKAAPALGIDGTAYHILDILIGLTRADDWKQDRRPLVAISNDKLSEYVCRSTRTVTRALKKLVEVGILAYRDSPTGRRFIYRNENSGKIDHAYGFDFSPARQRVAEFKQVADDFQARIRAAQEAKRTINRLSRGIVDACRTGRAQGIDCEVFLEELSTLLETPMMVLYRAEKITKLYQLVIEGLVSSGEEAVTTPDNKQIPHDMSCNHDINVIPYNNTDYQTHRTSSEPKVSPNTTQTQENAIETGTDSKTNSSMLDIKQQQNQKTISTHSSHTEHLSSISIGMIDGATTETKEMLGAGFTSWFDLVEATGQLRLAIGLSEDGWKQAVVSLGEKMAAAVLVVTVEKTLRNPDGISRPSGYFRACINRASNGKLALHKSLYGLALG